MHTPLRFLIFVLAISMPVGPYAAAANSKKIAPPKVNQDQEIKTRDYMIEISRHLGVTCNYCHDVKNFRLNDMKAWKKGKDHIRIVELLNSRGFMNGPKADCYLCHRGKAVPDYKEGVVSKVESPSPASKQEH